MSNDDIRIEFEKLCQAVQDCLESYSLPTPQAKIVAEAMATADLYGVTTHGTKILPFHIRKLNSAGYNLSPVFNIIKESEAFAIIDGSNSMGPVSAMHCINLCIKRSEKQGIYTVLSPNNNTYGAAFYYPLMAAQQKKIGITFCNSPAAMAPINGKERLLGTNPFSVVIPAYNESPIILDMATSKVAKSKFLEVKKKGEKLPDGWALDKDGNPTNDPNEGINGLVLPMAGFKGYAIAMIIDILSGLLSGAAWQNKVGKFYSEENKCMNVGFSFTVIDPKSVYGEAFLVHMDEYIYSLRRSDTVNDAVKIAIPGDNMHLSLKYNMEFGIRINDEVRKHLEAFL